MERKWINRNSFTWKEPRIDCEKCTSIDAQLFWRLKTENTATCHVCTRKSGKAERPQNFLKPETQNTVICEIRFLVHGS